VRKIAFFLGILAVQAAGQSVEVAPLTAQVNSSFRALSVVNNKIAWLAGSNGYVGRTTDGGITWQFHQVKNFEQFDFRSLYAFSNRQAIMANAGSPACILLTTDGGKTWKPVYTNTHPDAFFDGIDFWNNKEGIIYGDPIDGNMLLLRTSNGGKSWRTVTASPQPERGEASFAASGTGMRCFHKSDVVLPRAEQFPGCGFPLIKERLGNRSPCQSFRVRAAQEFFRLAYVALPGWWWAEITGRQVKQPIMFFSVPMPATPGRHRKCPHVATASVWNIYRVRCG
jgi:hypothetical protein